jgi:phenylacetate-coenzyme A ligase PaaK-like adenylate-forming protein
VNLYSGVLESLLLPANDLVRGRHYMEHRRFMEKSQWWSPEQMREFQWSALRKLLAHVFDSVPYYRRKYADAGIRLEDLRSWEDFRRLPVLTREEIRDHREELCSTTYTGKLLPHATGGSSGSPTRFYRTYESYDWRMAAKDRVYNWSGWRLGERSIYLWGAAVGHVPRLHAWKTKTREAIDRQLIFNTFSQSEALWRRIYAAAIKFRPKLAVGYVSSLEQFAAFLRATKQTIPSVRCVIAAAEPLFPRVRQDIESGFFAPIFNTYGSREFMSIAGECEYHHGLHINAENLVVETQDPSSDEPSEILVTDLHNYGMPFLRYAIGDLGMMSGGACPCGRGLPRLNSIEGRVLDALRSADGRIIPGEFFPHVLKEVPEILQYRVEQKSEDRIVISAVLAHSLSARSHTLLETEILKVFGPKTHWEILPVSEIPVLVSGKRRVTVGMVS